MGGEGQCYERAAKTTEVAPSALAADAVHAAASCCWHPLGVPSCMPVWLSPAC
jgi:hypothetical protein